MIAIPFVEGWLMDETRDWGIAHGAKFFNLGSKEDAYYEAFGRWWTEPEGDLIIVEQDIVPPADWPPETCEYEWCACWYWISVVTGELRDRRKPTDSGTAVPFGYGLGCTRFSEALRDQHPDIGRRAGEPIVFGPEPDPDPPKHWSVMDARIAFALMRHSYVAHDHGEARHLR